MLCLTLVYWLFSLYRIVLTNTITANLSKDKPRNRWKITGENILYRTKMRNQERYDRLISLVLFHFCFPLFVRPMMNKYGVVKYETSSKVYPIPFPLSNKIFLFLRLKFFQNSTLRWRDFSINYLFYFLFYFFLQDCIFDAFAPFGNIQ